MNNEKTIQLQIPLLLPGVEDYNDGCVKRLETALQSQRGISRAHLESENSALNICLHYDPNQISLEQVRSLASRAGTEIVNRYNHLLMPIAGLDCSDCVTVIEHSLERMQGVLDVSVSYVAQNLHVEFDRRLVDRAAIEKRIRSLGYEVPVVGMRSWFKDNREILFSLTAGLLVAVGWLGQTFFSLNSWVALSLFISAYIFGGWEISQHAWHALRERQFDTDLLMAAAAFGAACLGNFAEGGLLLFLFSFGHALEERALAHARSAVHALADLAPKTALVKRDGRELEISVEHVTLQDVVIIRPGVRLPVDGQVLSGRSALDQSPVTGESIPVEKEPGSWVFAGTINGEGALEVQVTRLAKDSTLARVMRLVEEAQTQKSPTQQLTEKFERVFVPAVLIVDVLMMIIPPLLGVPFRDSFLRAMTLLVAASPCALALGTPSAILAGIGQAARHGVLIKGGAHLENLGLLKAIAFDKTGTITRGQPEMTDLIPLAALNSDDVLALAAAVENQSAHPLAVAVVRAARVRQLAIPAASMVSSITGRGIQAQVNGQSVILGNLTMFLDNGLTFPDQTIQQIHELEDQGKTVIIICLDGIAIGLVAVADVLRQETRSTIARLKSLGVDKSVMLTGDNPLVASNIANQVGMSDYRAGLMPEDKLVVIRSLVQKYGCVGMVGDGVNDAPALANASVGIAMGGAGTDVALESADVVLMSDNLARLPFAIGLGRATRTIIAQNLIIALAVIAFLVVASITGWVGIGVAIILHEGSTILVVLNSLRLLGYRL